MNSHTLPDDWADHALDEPGILLGVSDLALTHADRIHGGLLLLLTDDRLRLQVPFMVDDIPRGADRQEKEDFARTMATTLSGPCPTGGIAVVVARRGSLRPTRGDQVWAEIVQAACARAGLVFLGCVVATPGGVALLDDSAAAA